MFFRGLQSNNCFYIFETPYPSCEADDKISSNGERNFQGPKSSIFVFQLKRNIDEVTEITTGFILDEGTVLAIKQSVKRDISGFPVLDKLFRSTHAERRGRRISSILSTGKFFFIPHYLYYLPSDLALSECHLFHSDLRSNIT